MSKKVLVLGGSGMLGSMVVRVLSKDSGLIVTSTVRGEAGLDDLKSLSPDARWKTLDVERATDRQLAEAIDQAEWVINAIGIIKPYARDHITDEVERAIRVNALFPYRLAKVAAQANASVIQIATDCVYSGAGGDYVETAKHDPLDVYGKTKSLGEVASPRVYHLRCSIIGPEIKAHVSLLDWFLRQPKAAVLKGFTDHLWNGVTTLHYARICAGIIQSGQNKSGLQHVLPGDRVSKADLLKLFQKYFKREDLVIQPVHSGMSINRTLSTENSEANTGLWRAAGYDVPPSLETMIAELAGQCTVGQTCS